MNPLQDCRQTKGQTHANQPVTTLSVSIDLFTDTAAILNSLDLRSIMGCPGGTRSVFMRALWAKRELHCIFFGKKAIIVTSKHGTTIFFSHYYPFIGKLKEKLARKARVNTERVYRIVLVPPGHPITLLKSTYIQYGRRVGKKVYYRLQLSSLFVLRFFHSETGYVVWSINLLETTSIHLVFYL